LQHRQSLGLVNPMLYQIERSSSAASVFDDIVSGSNDVGADIPGNGLPLGCCTARPGFDDASGLGSVNLAAFAPVAVALQPRVVSLGVSLPGRQRPVHSRAIRVSVACSSSCRLGAFALVTIGHATPFEVDSRVFRLAAAGRETILLNFSGSQLRRLRAGLRAHKRISAVVRAVEFNADAYGVLAQPGLSIQARTSAVRLTIRS
jgi:hypothetical protein